MLLNCGVETHVAPLLMLNSTGRLLVYLMVNDPSDDLHPGW